MRKSASMLLLLLVALLMVGSANDTIVSASGQPLGSANDAATMNRAPVSAERGEQIARDYLLANAADYGLSSADLADLRLTDVVTLRSSGAQVFHFQQTANGIRVQNGVLNVTLLTDGTVLFVGNRGVADLAKYATDTTPERSAREAIDDAATALNLRFDRATVRQSDTIGGAARETHFTGGNLSLATIPVKLVYQPMADGTLRLAWDVSVYQQDAQHYWSVRTDATTGDLLEKHDWVVSENFDQQLADSIALRSARGEDTSGYAPVPYAPRSGTEAVPNAPDSYRIYDIPVESPSHASPVPPADARTTITNPADPLASPFGWHDTNGAAGAEFTTTQGNNVHAYTDVDANNTPDASSSPDGGPTLDFIFPLDLTQPPSAYRPAAVTNLFAWNNFLHDVPYLYGFDEQAGNFQENNYGRGGLGSDYVQAEAQDGSGTNNANFLTLTDGQNPRMQMYVGTNPNPDVDGDLDNGVIAHEYGHGISNRLTGGPTNVSCLNNSEQMGEGWSDWQGLMFTMETGDTGSDARGIGTYLFGQPANGPGIRPAPYSTNFAVNNYDYNDRTSVAVPHGIGFLWATMLWEMNWNLIDRYGFNPDIYDYTALDDGNILAYQLVQDGMAIQPCSPGFEDGRDAILAADVALTGGDNRCDIWDAFAIRGMGFSADQGSSGSVSDGTAAFDMPTFCLGVDVTPSSQAICAGQTANYTVTLTTPFTQVVTLSGSGHPAGTTMSFVPNPVSPPFPANSAMTIGNTAGAAAGNYSLTITGTSASYVNTGSASLTVNTSAPGPVTLLTPPNGATNVSTAPTFTWNPVAGATSYDLQVATDVGFSNIVVNVNVPGTSHTPPALNISTQYFWRVRANNPCGNGVFGTPFSFTTGALFCISPNQPIVDNQTTTSNLVIGTAGTLTDLNLYLDVRHTFVGDLTFVLSNGTTTTTIINRPGRTTTGFGCGGNDIPGVSADDEGANGSFENSCGTGTPAYTAGWRLLGGDPASANVMNTFDGDPLNGTWTLSVSDAAGGDTGTVDEWCLEYTATGGATATPTATATNTTVPSTSTPTATPTNTTVPATNTPTATPTNTTVPATNTPTATPTNTTVPSTNTPTATPGSGNRVCSTVPIVVPDNLPAGATGTVNVALAGNITDLNVILTGTHSWVGDLAANISNGSTNVTFYDRPGVPASTFGCSGDNLPGVFGDDEGADGSFENSCQNATPAYTPGGHYTNNNPLSAFDGQPAAGTWTLTVSDGAGGDTGTITGWCVEFETGTGPTATPTTPPTVPDINVTPSAFEETHSSPPQTTNAVMNIQNVGTGALNWTIAEDDTRPWNNPNPTQPRDANAPVERLAAAGGATTSKVEAGPIVGDGSFEAGTPNPEWEEFSSNFGTPLCDAVCGTGGGTGPRTGLWWAWFGGTTAAETGILTQTVTIPSGSAELSFWLEIPATATGTNGFLSVRMDGTEVFRAEETTPGYGTYAEVTVDVSAYADGGAHELVFFSTTDAGSAVTNFFVDDVAITATAGGACSAPTDIAWLTVSPTNGSTAGGGSTPVTLTFNSATLAQGTYTGTLCIESNDPDEELVTVPVTLNVGPPTAIDLSTFSAPVSGINPADLAAAGLLLLAGAALILRRK